MWARLFLVGLATTLPIRAKGIWTLPPIIFPGRPEGWWGDEALKAETDTPQATLEQRHQAAGDVLALHCRGFFSVGALFFACPRGVFFGGGSLFGGAPHIRGEPPQKSPGGKTRKSRSSRSVR